MKKIKSFVHNKFTLAASLLLAGTMASHAVPTLKAGHTDIGLAYEDGAWDLHIHDGENDVEYEPGEAILGVGPAAQTVVPNNPAFTNFLGAAGSIVWILPQVENPDLLFLGIAAEEVPNGQFVGDTMRLELVGVTGPGEFAVYSVDGFGAPSVKMNTRDGLSMNDFVTVPALGHIDYNWAFSAPGTYKISFQATGNLNNGTNTFVDSGAVEYTFSVVASGSSVQHYTIVDLGTLGGTSSFALDVNNHGQVTGNSRYTNVAPNNTKLHAFSWTHGVMTDIGYLTNGVEFSRGYAINDSGLIVGESDNNISKAFLWDGTTMTNLGTLGGSSAVAHDINNAGEIVGSSSNGSASRPYRRGTNGVMEDLGTLLGTINSTGRAWAINEAGVAVGLSRNESNTTSQATLWNDGGIINLGSLAGGTNFSQAYAVNEAIQIVGGSTAGKVTPTSSTDLTRAFLWENGEITDLGALSSNTNFIHSEAKDINDASQTVGYIAKFSGSPTFGGAAMLWENGEARDLNTLVPANSGWVLQSAEGINDRGQIVGYGSFGGQTRAFLLEPTPVLSVLGANPNLFTFTLRGQVERTYEIQSSSTLTNWTTLTNISLTEPVAAFSVPGSDAQKFLRARMTND